jgi:hypothetical protein
LTLGDILDSCIDSAGGSAGDSSPCGNLFAISNAPHHAVPTDTIAAMMQIALDPTHNVTPIFQLYTPPGPFLPALSSAPSDWSLEMTSTVPTPTFSPTPGDYGVSPSITLSDSNPSAKIYYTTNGSKASSTSTQYTGAFTVPRSATIAAVAIVGGLSSLYASGTYTLPVSVAVAPTSITLGQSQTQAFTATVANSTDTAVSWSVNPSIGTISATGLYTAPASITSPQTVTVTATSVASPSTSASATISLITPITVSLNPASAKVSLAQSMTFTATVANTSNPSVTWSLSPSMGSITSSGVYTAPSTMPSPNTVTVTAASVADPTKSASSTVTVVPYAGNTYYLAPASSGGNDSNNGLSASSPWLTPNHALNCGDVILATSSSSYNAGNFGTGNWGSVTCAPGNNVAWLKCATFDGCKISTNSSMGMWIDQSYWGVQGWEVSVTLPATYGTCFWVAPNWNNPAEIHHIVLANDIANGCTQGGFNSVTTKGASEDYVAFVGDIAYNSVQGSNACASAFSIYEPANSDTQSGTHMYVAGNFAWENVEPNICNGGSPTDGDGVIFDTWSQYSYSGQGAIENNLVFLNGGYGYVVTNNNSAKVYLHNNTAYGDFNDPATGISYGGEINLYNTSNTVASYDLIQATVSNTGQGNPVFALAVGEANSTNQAFNEWLAGVNGNNIWDWGTTFSPGPNNTSGASPAFQNPSNPGPPNCGSYSTTVACMAATIANFTPTASGTAKQGYQQPSSTPDYDPYFPQWLCNVNLPAGLVTMGCEPAP